MLETITPVPLAATICFFMALLHTFSVKWFRHLALQYPAGSIKENFFHLLGEVEVVFGVWALIFLICFGIIEDFSTSIFYLETRSFTEPALIFVIMTVCSTEPILELTKIIIDSLSRLLPFSGELSFYLIILIVGPILGSFITEPAAMTVTALTLLNRLYKRQISMKLKYATLGLLFVNISIGGTLTPYAAAPVLMVASNWSWDLAFMFSNFGWKAIIAVCISTSLVTWINRRELLSLSKSQIKMQMKMPLWVPIIHLLFLILIVAAAHRPILFLGLFLFFLGLVTVTKEYQERLNLKEGLLVGFFLGGLIILGAPQRWWLEPVLSSLDSLPLYLGSLSLTAITDNAALTYLGSQVPDLSHSSRYALVAGSIVGGGLTIIANAPNPAGYSILNGAFGKEGISSWQLFYSSLLPTLIAAICFWLL
ncbi:MAG: hypothetical protein RJB66_157 [Pseudomonadota bacterium]|jgi:hypothetical protein